MKDIYVGIIIMAVFIVLGIFLLNGKGAWLIAGYNTLSKKDKEKVDKKKLCRNMGITMFAIAFSFIFTIIGEIIDKEWMAYITLVMVLVICLGAILAGAFSKKTEE